MEMTAVGLAAAVPDIAMSARTATEWALDRIAEGDGRQRAFRIVRVERALADADLVDDDPGVAPCAANLTRSPGSYRTRLAFRRSTAFCCRSTSSSASSARSPRSARTAGPSTRHVGR
jgi:hypothetical protein